MVAVGIGEALGVHERLQEGFRCRLHVRAGLQKVIEIHDLVLGNAARRRGRGRADPVFGRQGAADGRPDFHFVIRQVVQRHFAAIGFGIGRVDDLLCERTGIEGGRAFGGNGFQSCGIVRIGPFIAGRKRFTVRVEVGSGYRIVVEPDHRAQLFAAEQARHARGDFPAFLGQFDRGLEQACPVCPAAEIMRRLVECNLSRHADRMARLPGRDEIHHLSVLHEPVRSRRCRGRLATVEYRDLVLGMVVIDHESAAADAGALRFNRPSTV